MTDNKLIENLQNPALYPHPVEYFKVLQTHISWIILTGKFAYKIKKPVNFGFLDFSDLGKRKFYCEEELRLNKKSAPMIYEEVVAITNNIDTPELNGKGNVIEYALKMQEFDQEKLFSHLLAKDELTKKHFLGLAKTIAEYHLQANRNSPAELGTVEQVHAPVTQNFEQIRTFLTDKAELAQVQQAEEWANQQHQRWFEVFKQRKANGFIRECHGDLHVGNIVLLNDQPVIFDCVEFNEPFRWVDVMADIAFLLMDLDKNQKHLFANALLNVYLQETGDYAGLQILPYYLAYRAVVRAKISLFTQNAEPHKKDFFHQQYLNFMQLAEEYSKPRPTFLAITFGISGSGKSTVARQMAEEYGALQIRSDVERKRLAGFKSTDLTRSELMQGIYTDAATETTYQHLHELAELILQAGFPVIVDATFLKQSQRQDFFNLSQKLNVPFLILHCDTPKDSASMRIKRRRDTVSEANAAVLEIQHSTLEDLTSEEAPLSIQIKSPHASMEEIDRWLKQRRIL